MRFESECLANMLYRARYEVRWVKEFGGYSLGRFVDVQVETR